MAQKEKFGKFVLLEPTDSSGLGEEYRAAKLGQAGFEKIVQLLRLGPKISAHPQVAKTLMEQTKIAAQLQNPNVIRIFGIGKVETHYYISYEFVEGRSLKGIFARCRQENFPLAVDHSLLIASKVASALEYAHGRKNESGRYFHGLLNPAAIVVSFEGEVRLRGFGYWPGRVFDVGLADPEARYLAPEQAQSGAADTRSDIFALGAILFEGLTGHALFEAGRTDDVASLLKAAKLQSPVGEDDRLPKPIVDLLAKALVADPAARYREVQELRKAIDTQLFSGDFTPTTFNLAFFMHSLFRDDIEREGKQLKEEREASYGEFLAEEPAKPAAKPVAAPAPAAPVPAIARPDPEPRPVARDDAFHQTLSGIPAATIAAAVGPAPGHTAASGEAAAASAAGSSFTFHKEEPKRRTPVVAVLVLVALGAAGAAAYYFLGAAAPPAPPAPPPSVAPATTLTSEAQAALDKVRELDEKLKKLEEEKAAASALAEEQAKKRLEEQAKAKGEAVDPAALAKAQEEARKKAQAEQEKKALDEKKRLEDEKKAEEARLAEEQRKAEEARKAAEAASPSPSVPPPAAIKPGTLMNLSDLGVIAPVPEKTPPLQYPPLALSQRIQGDVDLNVLIDETGTVSDAQVVNGVVGKAGLNEAAIDNVKKRKYRPASKDGVPVKVWMPVKVRFTLPK